MHVSDGKRVRDVVWVLPLDRERLVNVEQREEQTPGAAALAHGCEAAAAQDPGSGGAGRLEDRGAQVVGAGLEPQAAQEEESARQGAVALLQLAALRQLGVPRSAHWRLRRVMTVMMSGMVSMAA
jgi:hypothetical protein